MPQPIPEVAYPSPRLILMRRTRAHTGFLLEAATFEELCLALKTTRGRRVLA